MITALSEWRSESSGSGRDESVDGAHLRDATSNEQYESVACSMVEVPR